MTFKEKLKTPFFWISMVKVSFIFFLLMTVLSLFVSSGKDILSGSWDKVHQINFANGNWKLFFGYKIIFSVLYGMYTVNKKLK